MHKYIHLFKMGIWSVFQHVIIIINSICRLLCRANCKTDTVEVPKKERL
jgi:hypothetical protein